MTSDGKPWAPHRFKELVRERYFISKNCNTSYTEVGELSVAEKNYLIEFISDELERDRKAIEQLKAKSESSKG